MFGACSVDVGRNSVAVGFSGRGVDLAVEVGVTTLSSVSNRSVAIAVAGDAIGRSSVGPAVVVMAKSMFTLGATGGWFISIGIAVVLSAVTVRVGAGGASKSPRSPANAPASLMVLGGRETDGGGGHGCSCSSRIPGARVKSGDNEIVIRFCEPGGFGPNSSVDMTSLW